MPRRFPTSEQVQEVNRRLIAYLAVADPDSGPVPQSAIEETFRALVDALWGAGLVFSGDSGTLEMTGWPDGAMGDIANVVMAVETIRAQPGPPGDLPAAFHARLFEHATGISGGILYVKGREDEAGKMPPPLKVTGPNLMDAFPAIGERWGIVDRLAEAGIIEANPPMSGKKYVVQFLRQGDYEHTLAIIAKGKAVR